MARLLRDAEKISGIKYNVSSYADIVDAIHVVQNEMGITGTTAKEASTTIQGSLKSAKSAWQDLLTGLSDDNANIDKLVNNFFDSVVTVGENIIPRIGVVLNGITNMIEKLAPKITAKLPSIFKQVLPSVVKGATSLLNALIGVLPQFAKLIVKELPDFIKAVASIFKGIVNALPDLVKTIAKALPTLIPQIVTALADMVVYLLKHIGEILQPLIDNLPQIIIAVVDSLLDNLPNLLEGINSLVMGIVKAIPSIISSLISVLPFIVERVILSLLECLPQIINGLIELTARIVARFPEITMGIIKALPDVIATMAKELIECAPKIWKAFSQIFTNAWTTIQEVFAPIGEFFFNIFSGAVDGIKLAWEGVTGFFSGIWDGITGVFSGIGDWFSGIFDDAVGGIKGAWEGIQKWFQDLWEGIWTVIKAPINKIIGGINAIIDGLNTLSIDIPDWVPLVGGQTWGVDIPNIPELAAKGGIVDKPTNLIAGEAGREAIIPLERNTQGIKAIASELLSSFYDGDNFTQTPNKGAGGKVVNINLYLDNVNVKNDDDIEDVANKVSERIAEKLVVEGMAVG